jgi:hypothetical protein
MTNVSFRFGPDDRHECKIVCGWTGMERYYVDGVLVKRCWRLRGGRQEFTAEGHQIQVRFQSTLNGALGEAFVDGERKAEDLFAEFNARFERLRKDPPWWLVVIQWFVGVTILCVLAILVYWAWKSLNVKLPF